MHNQMGSQNINNFVALVYLLHQIDHKLYKFQITRKPELFTKHDNDLLNPNKLPVTKLSDMTILAKVFTK